MLDACLEQLETESFRQTETRRVILTILHETTEPLTPSDILVACHQAGRKANKTTIYRDLGAMERAGVVRRVMVSDRKQYFELTERGHHHHLVCSRCNAIEDVVFSGEDQLLKRSQQVAREKGFTIEQYSVEFFGVCKHCV